MLSDKFSIKGQLNIKRFDKNKVLVEERDIKNLVVYNGKKLIVSRLYSDKRSPINVNAVSAGDGSFVTYTFDTAQLEAPYREGQHITIAGISPEEYNGSFRVVTSTTTNVTVENTYIGTYISGGIIAGFDNSIISDMGIGTGSTAANLSDVALYNEVERESIYSTQMLFDDGDSTISYIAQFPPSGSLQILQEAGLFNTENTMMCRSVFNPVTKLQTDSLEILWRVTIA